MMGCSFEAAGRYCYYRRGILTAEAGSRVPGRGQIGVCI